MALSQEAKDRALAVEQELRNAYFDAEDAGEEIRGAGLERYYKDLYRMRVLGNLSSRRNPDGTPAEIVPAEDDDVSQLVGHVQAYLG